MTAKDPKRGPGTARWGRLRGWGGVTAMAAACAVTASLTLLPLSHGGKDAFDAQGRGPERPTPFRRGRTTARPRRPACRPPKWTATPSSGSRRAAN